MLLGLLAAAACLLGVGLTAEALVRIPLWLASRTDGRTMNPFLGQPAPDFVLTDLAGEEFHLQGALARGPVVLEFTSFT